MKIKMSSSQDRIIALIDMDCFFCQVESREQPSLKGKPLVVCQNNVVLAVSYEAKARGIDRSRFLRSEEAKEICPDLQVVSSPVAHGKCDNTKYRLAGQEVIQVLKNHCEIVERASVDEAYLDITKLVEARIESSHSSKDLKTSLINTFVVGYCDPSNDETQRSQGIEKWLEEVMDDINDDQARRLAIAAAIIEEFRKEILEKCQFTCSAGISYNKVLAKLACGLHKPNKQTILSSDEVPELFTSIPVNKVRNLGGKIGKILIENLSCSSMADLMQFTLQDFKKNFDDKTANWLFNIARGIDNEAVTPRLLCKSIAASKQFFGKSAITDLEGLRVWVDDLAGDLVERLELDLMDNQRRATTLTISYQYLVDKKTVSQSKSSTMGSYKAERIANLAFDVVSKAMLGPIAFLSLGSSKFVNVQKSGNFVDYFKIINDKKGESEGKSLNKNKIDKDENCENKREIEHLSNISLEEKESNVKGRESLIKLKDIFPDLNNIDTSVLELLPIALQDEAKSYLKSNNEIKKCQSPISNDKSPKSMNVKSRISDGKGRNGNTLQNFFVKNHSSNVDNASMIRCSECSQMIEEHKYAEHSDFHVAQNLQKNINKSLAQDKLGESSKRNREKSASPQANKKTRSIESYFGKR